MKIRKIKKNKFKRILRKKLKELAFDYLQTLKNIHSKVKHINYTSLEKQNYMSKFQTRETYLLFKLRSRMINLKANFRNFYNDQDLSCDLCQKGIEENQAHLLECDTLIKNCKELYDDQSVEYEDIFEEQEKQLKATRLFQVVLETRERLLEEKISQEA